MKNFGEKLKQQELRMAIIKDKIDVFSSQVENYMEMPEVIEETKEVEAAEPAYVSVD